jgi:hypothetical protein
MHLDHGLCSLGTIRAPIRPFMLLKYHRGRDLYSAPDVSGFHHHCNGFHRHALLSMSMYWYPLRQVEASHPVAEERPRSQHELSSTDLESSFGIII